VQLTFEGKTGVLAYTTPRGAKKLKFGMGEYLETTFPETHYPGHRLGCPANREYRCVNCGAWLQERTLAIRTEILDEFVGNLTMVLSFNGEEISIEMHKAAQFFLDEYQGYASGKLVDPKL